MKKNIFLMAMLGICLALGMVLIGCSDPTDPTQFTVTFNANGGSVTPGTEIVDEGSSIDPLPEPTKTGTDTFWGWFTSDGTNDVWGGEFTSSTKVTDHITVYARWGSTDKPTTYTVTFNPDGGKVSPTTIQVVSGDKVGSLPTPTKSGNAFGGWFIGQDQFFDATSKITKDITVIAKWVATGGTGGKFTGTWKNSSSVTLIVGSTSSNHNGIELFEFILSGNGASREGSLGDNNNSTEILFTGMKGEANGGYNDVSYKYTLSGGTLTLTDRVNGTAFNDILGSEGSHTFTKQTTGSDNKPAIFPDNWKTLDKKGWNAWLDKIDQDAITNEVGTFFDKHWNELTPGGKEFWEELIPNGDNGEETPAAQRGIWKKENITLEIGASQLKISGANYQALNTTFTITGISQNKDGSTFYRFADYGMNCKLNGTTFVIFTGSGPDELHGNWTKASNDSKTNVELLIGKWYSNKDPELWSEFGSDGKYTQSKYLEGPSTYKATETTITVNDEFFMSYTITKDGNKLTLTLIYPEEGMSPSISTRDL